MKNTLVATALSVVFGLAMLTACGSGGDEKGTPTPEHDHICVKYKTKPHAYTFKSEEAGMNAACYLMTGFEPDGKQSNLFCCK